MSWLRTPKDCPIDGGVHLASKTDHFLFVSPFTRQRPESPIALAVVDTVSYSVVYPTVWYS
jgi:hypothetical protein